MKFNGDDNGKISFFQYPVIFIILKFLSTQNCSHANNILRGLLEGKL
ncbi:MAG: hypothetical protein Q8S84_07000 [bacterium]|nr:hypothetical protein [bacterium]MDP3381205.1 hypothetical protein [bacterium]